MTSSTNNSGISRRKAIQSVLGVGVAGLGLTLPASSYAYAASPPPPAYYRDKVKITRLETFLIKPRWIFLRIHTDVGAVGLGEPLLEGRALTIQTAIKEVEPYLIGKDPGRWCPIGRPFTATLFTAAAVF